MDAISDLPTGALVASTLAAALVVQQVLRCVGSGLRTRRETFRDQHVVVTGGSKGLGRELVQQLLMEGAKVTVMARQQAVLDEMQSSLGPLFPDKLFTVSTDVMDEQAVASSFEQATETHGAVDFLVTCAGTALTGLFGDREASDYKRSMDLNYMGTVYALKAVIPHMQQRRQGRVLLVASALSMCGMVGYSAYAPSKWALRGLADCLRNELRADNINVHIAYPANMDTPGFEIENKTKPPQTQAIEAGEALYPPAKVATSILSGIKAGHFNLHCGDLGTNILGMVTAGMSPRNNAVLEALLLPLLVVVGWVYRSMWDKEVMNPKYRKEG